MEKMETQLVRQVPLSEQVAEKIRDQIIRQNLAPGERLASERELGEQFGVSRTVIREAVRALIAKGLIAARTGSGLVVAEVKAVDVAESMKLYLRGRETFDYLDLHEVRTTLETTIVRAASQRSTPDDQAALIDYCDRMDNSLEDSEQASQCDLQFHRALAKATHNDFFLLLHDVLSEVLMEARRTTFAFDPDRMARVARVHREIANAVNAGREEEAALLMADHLEDVKDTWNREQLFNT